MASCVRNNLKYQYWRMTEPCRDWNTGPKFNFSWPKDYFPEFTIAAAHLLCRFCGEEWQHMGGCSWPCASHDVYDWDQPACP